MRFGSLFSGAGGLDLGPEQAGLPVKWQVESDQYCRTLLERHWPGVPKVESVEEAARGNLPPVDLVAGGDPCPIRSRARKRALATKHPDLSGYFLAVVGKLRPRWVLRENVFAPDALDFAAALEVFGYGVVAVGLDSRDFTAQSRRRQFLIGCPPGRAAVLRRVLLDAADGLGFSASGAEETTPIAACLTAHPSRLAAEDTYCYEPGRGLRTLAPEECEGLQGFPRGWTDGFSRSRRRIMLGNAVTVPKAEWLGRRIAEANAERRAA
jgi:DNA (cytosine-5)-methyltransferase 1